MKVLAVSDVEARRFYDYYTPGKLDGYDLILACGDLSKGYLEFLTTVGSIPVLYVRGNHDDAFLKDPPEGCICIEDQIFVYNGVRILGLGGSYQYRDGENMYTEQQMRWRIFKLWRQLRRHKGFDILVTHAPARHINDFDSLSHRGFSCFVELIEKYEPQYFVHGHIHRNYGFKIPKVTQHGKTTIYNAYEYCEFEITGKGGKDG
jgi:Icc-related predicted phosphoesterase